MNPLDLPNNAVRMEAHNLNVSFNSRSGVHRLCLELGAEDWETVKTAKLEGAKFAMALARIDYDNPQAAPVSVEEPAAPEKKKRHMNATEIRAIELCRDPMFHCFLTIIKPDAVTNEKIARSYILSRCHVSHRYEIEKSKDAAIAFGKILEEFEAYRKEFEAYQKENAPW